MDLIALDFETFYGDDYTLSKLTTEAYIRDPRFEAIMCSFKVNAEKTFWVPRDDIGRALRDTRVAKSAVIAHHAHFDGLILNHHYGCRPARWFDTLGMARAVHGANARLSLAKLATFYGLEEKGGEVVNAKGLRFADFPAWQLKKYGDYCCHDTDLCRTIFDRLLPYFQARPNVELQIYDAIVRMFTEPTFELDIPMLEKYRSWIAAEKASLLMQAGVQASDVMSNPKFAQALLDVGIEPPRKISPSTGLTTFAFAKTDPGMQALQEHPDEMIQVLVEARLKNKTTLMERSAERFIGMGQRGAATVYLKVSGASGTHRLAGGDKTNWQSLKRGSDLRNSAKAPKGMMCVVVDSSTIEARLLDWLAGQDDMVQVYELADKKLGPDMYCTIAERIYERPINKTDDPEERQMGKRAKLGLGFGMGDNKFAISVRREAKDKDGKPLVLSPEFAKKVVDIYRGAHKQVGKLWRRGEDALKAIAAGQIDVPLDFRGIVKTCKDGLIMPNGLKILYPELKWEPYMEPNPSNPDELRPTMMHGKERGEWTFWNGKMREHIYGAKVIENIIQCLARIIVFTQCHRTVVRLRKEQTQNKWAHSVHDEGVFVTPAFYAPYVLDVAMEEFRRPLDWCETLPLNCEGGIHERYGKAKT